MIRTNLGCAGFGDNFVRGRSVNDAVMGREPYWSAVSLFIGGPSLAARECQLLDDLSIALISPDPRIWPLKLMWLQGCHGGRSAGLAGAIAHLEPAIHGPWTFGRLARDLVELAALIEVDERSEVIEAWARRKLADGSLARFGTPGRNEDERFVLAMRRIRELGLAGGGHVQAMLDLAGAVGHLRPELRPNIDWAVAASLLDASLTPDQIGLMGVVMLIPQILGTVDEAARLRPDTLRHLPRENVIYRGPAPVRSPRALRA